MSTNYIRMNDLLLQVDAEYIGDTQWADVSGHPIIAGNHHNHLITIRSDNGQEEEFQAWGSLANPDCFESDELGPYDALIILCREAWDLLEGGIEDLLDPAVYDDPYEYDDAVRKLQDAMQITADKLSRLGLDDEMLLTIANADSEEYYNVLYDERLGSDVIYPKEYF